MKDILGKLRICLHLFNDCRKFLHGFRSQLGRHTEIQHLDSGSKLLHKGFLLTGTAITVEPSADPGGMGYLSSHLLHIVGV